MPDLNFIRISSYMVGGGRGVESSGERKRVSEKGALIKAAKYTGFIYRQIKACTYVFI